MRTIMSRDRRQRGMRNANIEEIWNDYVGLCKQGMEQLQEVN